MAASGGFRSDLSITCKTDGNFGNVNAGVLFSKVAKPCKLRLIASLNNFIQRGLEIFLAKSIIPQMLNLVGDLSSLRSCDQGTPAGTAQ